MLRFAVPCAAVRNNRVVWCKECCVRRYIILITFMIFASMALHPAGAAPRIRINLDGPWQIAKAHLIPLGSDAVALHGWRWRRAGLGINSPPNAVPPAILT